MVDTQGLRALVEVARHGSVAAAADRLGYTPSAVSQQVKRLERDIGAALLERHGRGVLLTERGRSLAAGADGLLDELDRLAARAGAEDARSLAPLRIASFSTATRGLFAPMLAQLLAEGLALPRVTSVDPLEAIELVSDGVVDLAVIHDWQGYPVVLPEHVQTEPLLDDVADVVLSVEHPLADRATIDRHELVDERWGSTPRGQICAEALQRVFADLGRLPRVVAEDPDWATLVALAEHGILVVLLPRLGRGELPPGVRAVPLTERDQVRHVSVAYRRTMADSPGVRHAVDLLRAEAAALASGSPNP
ncbi:MAG: LysR family transcriptional regulator [Microbacteriaceae bacterium]|nr:LysR family transcriptional regulator [Microbacteriaceae bacterium]